MELSENKEMKREGKLGKEKEKMEWRSKLRVTDGKEGREGGRSGWGAEGWRNEGKEEWRNGGEATVSTPLVSSNSEHL